MDDLISRQAVRHILNHEVKMPINVWKKLFKLVDTLPSVQPEQKFGRWIPCNKKLPLEYETVLITGKMKYASDKEYEYFVDCAFVGSLNGTPDNFSPFDFETWNDWYEGQEEYYILAWMPLPEPYKAESEDEK